MMGYEGSSMKTQKRLFAAVAALCWAGSAFAGQVAVSSPDGHAEIRIEDDASRFSVLRRGEAVIADSPLGLEFDGAPAFGALALESREDTEVDRIIPLAATKASSARDHYRGATLTFREKGGDADAPARRLVLDVRAYDEGVAFRYRIDDPAPVRLNGERTAFVPAGDPSCLATEFDKSHEKPFERQRISQLATDKGYDVPLVCATASGRTHYAITQSHLQGYTGASLWRQGAAMQLRLSAVPGRDGPAYVSRGGLRTAWRVVMMADRAGDLIASPLVGNLNPPPEGDFSWVKPGKSAWNWWSGPSDGAKAEMGAFRRYIDFAAESGFPYALLDAGWAWGSGPCCEARPETDLTRPVDGVDMPALVRYAESRGVSLLLWAHWKHMDARMDEVLDTWVRWGIRGIKVDFMERDDQEMVEFHERIAAATAERKLLLNLHGAYMPAGLQRTYPNFITQEGVMGAEWNKWTPLITARHNLMLPYTRMLTGPMDYTPGGFRNRTPETFEVRDVLPFTQTTRGQALAMFVVYDSPLQMVADDPDAYRDAAGFEFVRRVPTAWDETRFLAGEPGRDIVLARRSGAAWYLGAMTADEARTARVPLGFLPEGRYRATVWEDGEAPDDVRRSERTVAAGDVLELRQSPAGGAVAILEPAGP